MVNVFAGFEVNKDIVDFFTLDDSGKSFGRQVAFNREGVKSLSMDIPLGSHCVMEATEPYHLKLATWLFQQGYAVSMIKRMEISRFAQIKQSTDKTCKVDAKMLAEYAQTERPPLWEPSTRYITQLEQVNTAIELFQKIRTERINLMEEFKSMGELDSFIESHMKESLEFEDESIKEMEENMEEIIKNEHKAMTSKLI